MDGIGHSRIEGLSSVSGTDRGTMHQRTGLGAGKHLSAMRKVGALSHDKRNIAQARRHVNGGGMKIQLMDAITTLRTLARCRRR
jgi:hypothetical protein